MKFKEFKQSLGSPQPAYWVKTKDDYIVQKLRELIESRVDEAARAFDWSIVDLKRDAATEPDRTVEVTDRARTSPWMSSHRWLLVLNAEQGSAALGQYLKAPSERSVMILVAHRKGKGWPGLPTVEMGDSSPRQWLMARVRQEDYEIEPAALDLLLDLVGEDLKRLDGELEKQILYEAETRRISTESVLAMTFDTRERDVFEIISCLAARDATGALSLLHRLTEGGASPLGLLGMLYWNFKRLLVAREQMERGRSFDPLVKSLKIWSFRQHEKRVREFSVEFLQQVLLRLRETDRLLKSTDLDAGMQLERLVVDTCRRRYA